MTTKRKSSTKKAAKKKSSKAKSITAFTMINADTLVKGESGPAVPFSKVSAAFFEYVKDNPGWDIDSLTFRASDDGNVEVFGYAVLIDEKPPHPFWQWVIVVLGWIMAISVIAWVFNEWVAQ